MLQPSMTSRLCVAPGIAITLALLVPAWSAHAEGCAFAEFGEGHGAEIIDARSRRLTDGREIRLAGIEVSASDAVTANRDSALARIAGDQDVILEGDDDA